PAARSPATTAGNPAASLRKKRNSSSGTRCLPLMRRRSSAVSSPRRRRCTGWESSVCTVSSGLKPTKARHHLPRTSGSTRAVPGGFWCAIHAIGDRANRWVLDAYDAQAEASGHLGARHRIEHVQLLHPDDLPRLARLRVVASMQPIHATSDRDIAERYWGGRSRYAYAWRSLLDHGAVLAFGSDAPVETPDVLQGVYAAVTRRRAGEPHGAAWYPQEALTLDEAFRAYSVGAAYASGQEGSRGTLTAGKVADFAVLDHDVMQAPPEI